MEETRKKKKKENKKTNLVDEFGDVLLESLHNIDQSLDFMSFVMINHALGADGLLVCLAVSVDLQVRIICKLSVRFWTPKQ